MRVVVPLLWRGARKGGVVVPLGLRSRRGSTTCIHAGVPWRGARKGGVVINPETHMKTHATLTMVILMAYPALLAGMIIVDCLLLAIALFTGWWWLLVTGIIATAAFIAWRCWMMARLDEL